MNVLSLFDGMSCGQIALERAGIKVDNYFASEIDKYAIEVTQKNYPNTIRLGDILKVFAKNLPKIDLLIGGSPCQGFSQAGNGLNFNDPRSKLFFEFVRLLKECKPKYFLLENVRMKKKYQDIISKYLNIKPIYINSDLLSAQTRKRFYWTNIPNIKQPKNKKIYLKDILENQSINPNILQLAHGGNKGGLRAKNGKVPSITSSSWAYNNLLVDQCIQINPDKSCGGRQPSIQNRVYFEKGKSLALNTFCVHRVAKKYLDNINCLIRKLTPIECERLQTVPDNYTNYVSNSQRYKMLGNGWTVDVIVHILKNIK